MKYIVTVKTQLETFNIIGITRDVLFYAIRAYYNGDEILKLGGKTYSLKRIQEFVIHEFDSDERLKEFLDYIKLYNLKKEAITGKQYFETEQIDKYGSDVSSEYLTIDRSDIIGDTKEESILTEESQEILAGINQLLERLSKIEMGQEIIYEDLRKDIEEVKDFIGKVSKKTVRQLVIGKLVDAGLGALASDALSAIKESGVLKIGI